MNKLRTVLVGAVWSSKVALQVLAAAGYLPVLLVTLPVEKAARHSDFVDLGPLGESLGVPVMRVADLNSADVVAALRELRPDILMVIGWSQLCGPEFLKTARIGAIGYHPTLLPKMRGRAALAWTILLGLRETGGSLFWMDDGMDSGAIALQRRVPLTGREYLSELIQLHSQALGEMIPLLLEQIRRGETPATPQDHLNATYLAVRRPADGEIDWSCEAADIERLIRSVSRPYPGAFTYIRNSKLVVWSARVVHHPRWHAQQGQIFVWDEEIPIVRCGGGTDLALLEVEVVTEANAPNASPLRGQPLLGRRG